MWILQTSFVFSANENYIQNQLLSINKISFESKWMATTFKKWQGMKPETQ